MPTETVIRILGTIFIVIGAINLIKPQLFRHILRFYRKGKRHYLAACLRFILAAVFLIAARHCRIPIVIIILGLLFIISGLLILSLGLKRIKAILEWYDTQPLGIFQAIAFIVLIMGLIVVYSA